jgi:hypothetical protein
MAFGGSAITFNSVGKVVSLADDRKAAATTRSKRACPCSAAALSLYSRTKNGTSKFQ